LQYAHVAATANNDKPATTDSSTKKCAFSEIMERDKKERIMPEAPTKEQWTSLVKM
jgi:hypothetical protein